MDSVPGMTTQAPARSRPLGAARPGTLVYLRVKPHSVKAWREENELPGRELMRDGVWLD